LYTKNPQGNITLILLPSSLNLTSSQPLYMEANLVDINAQSPQVLLRLIDLEHEFLMSFGHVVKSEDSPTEFEEEVCAEGDEDPKGELVKFWLASNPPLFVEGTVRTTGTISVWIVIGMGIRLK